MSDCIPLDIQEEIVTRIPDVKSLIRFRSVSKTWKSLIDSSQFITHHAQRDHHHHRILLSYTTGDDQALKTKYVSILDDDDNFPKHKVPFPIPPSYYPSLVGTSSHGLFCFRNNSVGKTVAVVWNPSTRKSITIDLHDCNNTVFGFGVCPHTLHFKLIKISYICSSLELENLSCIPCQVEVFTCGVWRSPLCINNLPRRTIGFLYDKDQVVIDGFIYWRAYDRIPSNDTDSWGNRHGIVPLIISFDMTSDEFSEIYLPNGLVHSHPVIYISKIKESLVILQEKRVSYKRVFDVWKMEHGVSKTFSKLYTISMPEASVARVHGFRKSGEPIISSTVTFPRYAATLNVYEPDSRKIKDVGISALRGVIWWSSYEETLRSLDY